MLLPNLEEFGFYCVEAFPKDSYTNNILLIFSESDVFFIT